MSQKQYNRRFGLLCLILALVTAALYWPVHGYEFINYDDEDYVSKNSHVHSGLTRQGLKWAFTADVANNWHPITWLSHMFDWQMYGSHPGGHHLTNVLFHVANVLLLFLVLKQMTGGVGKSLVVAALFALHPLRVESVAWVSERKDVLSAFFFLLTLWAYCRYVGAKKASCRPQNSAPKERHAKDSASQAQSPQPYYLLALLFFALGLMSKPMIVTLPFVLLLLDYWPLARSKFEIQGTAKDWFGLVVEKIPFFILSAASSAVTVLVQHEAITTMETFTVGERLANAIVSYQRYLRKMFWPSDLAVFYPHPGRWPTSYVVLSAVVLVLISAVVLWKYRRHPWLPVGWCWFLGTTFPAIGLLQVGIQSMADRYTYIPQIGLLVILVWGASEWFAHWRLPKIVPATLALGAVAGLVFMTSIQLRYWKDNETLFRHALKVTPPNDISCNNLAATLTLQGKTGEAITNYLEAIHVNPKNHIAFQNLGLLLFDQGKMDVAIDCFSRALQLNTNLHLAQNNWGLALALKGNVDEALIHLAESVRLNPDYAEAQNNLGNALMMKGRFEEAIKHFSIALQIDPSCTKAYQNLGKALLTDGHAAKAIPPLQAALLKEPDNSESHYFLGSALAKEGKMNEAMEHYLAALRGSPENVDVLRDLGLALANSGKLDEAIGCLAKAVQLRPDDPVLHNNLGNALTLQNRLDEAITQYTAVLKINPDLAETHYNLGSIFAQQGRRLDALEHLIRSVQLKPDYAAAKQKLDALNAAR